MRLIDADRFKDNIMSGLYVLCQENKEDIAWAIDSEPTVKPIIDPSFITDLDAVKDWNICGYRVEDLVKLSLILRDRRIEDVDLRNYNDCFFNGYCKAYDEIHNSIKKMMDDLIETKGGAE